MAFKIGVALNRTAFNVSCGKGNLRLICPINLGVLSQRLIWTESPKFGKSVDNRIWKDQLPKPGVKHKAYRRIVHYPEEYTVKPLNVTNLAGRDPVTGRVIAKGIGGGLKHKYHWIQWKREGPKEGKPLEEKVIQIMDDGCRTAKIALVASGDSLKYYLATENMKAGDIIRTSSHIPRIPVRPNEGDAYPLGALPTGTQVHCIELYPGYEFHYIHSAGTCGILKRKIGERCIVQLPSKHEIALSQECMAVVGRLSNAIHQTIHLGSPQKLRELGYRPRSGLWQRKSGKHGRKIKPLPPVKEFDKPATYKLETLVLTLPEPRQIIW